MRLVSVRAYIYLCKLRIEKREKKSNRLLEMDGPGNNILFDGQVNTSQVQDLHYLSIIYLFHKRLILP